MSKEKYRYRADISLLGESAVYPGHPATIAFVIAHNFETWEDANQKNESGDSAALASSAIPGAGGRVAAAMALMHYVRNGNMSLDEFFARAEEIDASEPVFNGKGSPEQAEKLRPWLEENLLKWLRK